MSSRTYEGADTWRNHLIETDKCIPKPLLANAIAAFREHPGMQSVVAFDEFALQTVLVGVPPWARIGLSEWQERPWRPDDDTLATDWLQHLGILVNTATTAQAVETVARERSFHPVIDYLDALEWDGVQRVGLWLSRYVGAAPTAYSDAVGRAVLISAVARIREPGCKVDTVLILEGAQGARKSTAVKTLFDPWFSDELAELGTKDAAMQTRGVMCVEISELDAMSRGEVAKIKAFLSRTTDRFRPPYGHRVIESPRSCIFVGTTNSDSYLKDETGGRRFWPVKVGIVDIEGLAEARDQLWAEADMMFMRGDQWWISNTAMKAEAEDQQRKRYIGDPWTEAVSVYTEAKSEVTINVTLVNAIGLEIARCGQLEQNRVQRILVSLSFMQVQVRRNERRIRAYFRPVTPVTPEAETRDSGAETRDGGGVGGSGFRTADNVTPFRASPPVTPVTPVTQEVPAAQPMSPLSPLSHPRF